MSALDPEPGGLHDFSRRFILAALILSAGLGLARLVVRPNEPPPSPPAGQIVYVDVAGWYRSTPDEVAVRTPFDLSLTGLPDGLPLSFGAWHGEDRSHDEAADVWLSDPDVSVERTYRRSDGALVWLAAFGSRGNKSYHLFEHTPETCYPLAGWKVQRFEVAQLPLGPRPLPVNRGLAHNGTGQLVFLYLYIRDSPARDPARGVLSLRLSAPVRESPEATFAMLAEEFLPELFPATLSWRRF